MDDPVANSISTVQVVAVLIGTVIPILVALVTKSTWTSLQKALVHLFLAGVVSFGAEFINDSNFVWQQALLTTVVTFVTGVATYMGLLRYTPLAGANSPVARAITG